jgi:hypothetical protein
LSAHGRLQRPENAASLQVLVLEIDCSPTLAFEAPGLAEAQEICRDTDLRADLMALTSDGAPVCAPNSALLPRIAAQEEIAAFRHAVQLSALELRALARQNGNLSAAAPLRTKNKPTVRKM